jgi:hypothetical protein
MPNRIVHHHLLEGLPTVSVAESKLFLLQQSDRSQECLNTMQTNFCESVVILTEISQILVSLTCAVAVLHLYYVMLISIKNRSANAVVSESSYIYHPQSG